MKALITAGGRGTRLRPITYTRNKHLVPLANHAMIHLAIEKIAQAGVRDIIISINEGETDFPKLVQKDLKADVKLTFVEQKGGALGVAHVIKNARKYLEGEDFIFYLGDNIVLGDVGEYVRKFQKEKLDCLLCISEVKDPQRFGVPVIQDGRIVEVIEKPDIPPSNFAVTGIYIYGQAIFDAVEAIEPSARGEYEISDAHTKLIEQGKKVGYAEITGWWKDTGKPEDLLEGNQLLLNQIKTSQISDTAHIDPQVKIQGIVEIGDDVQLQGDTFIRGPVSISNGTIIKDAYIGPFSSIGAQVFIENAEIEHSIVMDTSSIRVGCRIVDSIVGFNASITPVGDTFPKGHKLIIGDNSQVEL
jgi:glucose-1-phosphate thymidylyltransferase